MILLHVLSYDQNLIFFLNLLRFEKFNKEDNILLYCRSGRRSLLGAKILVKNGYKNIYDLKGGVISVDKSILDFIPKEDILDFIDSDKTILEEIPKETILEELD